MNLDQLRVTVRTQLDLDETDLPNPLLDLFIQEGFDRIISLEARWPFFEVLWSVPVAAGASSTPLPVDAREVESIFGANGRIVHIDSRHAEDTFGLQQTGTGVPRFWNQIGTTIHLWPSPLGTATTLQMRGFRRPADWIGLGASAEVDADVRLHLPIIWYACSAAMAQQEDEVLEATYLNRFRESATIAHDDVMRPWTGAPKILNGYAGMSTLGRQPQLILGTPFAVPFDGTVQGGTP